jgi:hypothetical protein
MALKLACVDRFIGEALKFFWNLDGNALGTLSASDDDHSMQAMLSSQTGSRILG